MADSTPFVAADIARWLTRVLRNFSEYRIDDRIFDADAVAVVAVDRAEFVITRERWTDLLDGADHRELETDLRHWADHHLAYPSEG